MKWDSANVPKNLKYTTQAAPAIPMGFGKNWGL